MLDKPLFVKTSKELARLNSHKCKPFFVDVFPGQLKELFLIENPQFVAEQKSALSSKEFAGFAKKKERNFVRIYFPWSNKLVKTVESSDYFKLRTNRNKNIVTAEEQRKLADFTVGIVGLSVGGNIATTLAFSGISQNMKLADFDTLDTTNLNRVRARLSDVGRPKIEIISEQLYDINPFIKIHPFNRGLNKKNLANFVNGSPKPRLIFEIIDDFEIKILLRKEAKKQKVPVVMLTSLGDSVLIDIERYDIDSKTKLFNGKVSDVILNKILAGSIGEKEKHEYAMEIVGIDNIPLKVKNSITEIGESLVGRSQIMSTVTIASGLASFIARKIALSEKLPSGRTLVKFDNLLGS